MSSIKLNSKRNEPRKFKIRRKNTMNKALNSDNSLLQPATDLTPFGKKMFYSIKKAHPELNNSDNYLLNLLISEYQIFMKMNSYITRNGVINSDGRKSAQFMVWKTSVDQILKLSSHLNLTPSNRINADFHNQKNDDPLKAVIR